MAHPKVNSQSASLWPGGAKFALFLSHDIDKIFDRELFYSLAALNRIRRLLLRGEGRRACLAGRRLARALFAPKPPELDFQTILDIEARHGFHSTFFVLHDRRWRRRGARYDIQAPALRRITTMITEAGGEIGLHGGVYRFNQAAAYRESRDALRTALGVAPIGIRNHFLLFSGVETWVAQDAAGFQYDSSFGYSDRIGPRDGRMIPFFAEDPAHGGKMKILELPLTVMDVALFRDGTTGEMALERAWAAIEPVIEAGGLVTLLWHNDYFNEPEYRDWQWTYEQLLARLAQQQPWCVTGSEINDWWRSRSEVRALDKRGNSI
ncbi:MAG: polysaccharide deacetylase family protein [Kiritimatiellia bacterium]|jgi:peptidoglycan/xylan/chitin deacetylase (PgdA/CDA1 family)|nr:polysaccharide deacetylase family protein [Kiritimatiellia bacterium]